MNKYVLAEADTGPKLDGDKLGRAALAFLCPSQSSRGQSCLAQNRSGRARFIAHCWLAAVILFGAGVSKSHAQLSQQEVQRQDAIATVNSSMRIFKGQKSGTCFVVSKEVKGQDTPQLWLVTAKHVLTNNKAKDAKLVIRSRQDDGSIKRREIEIEIRNEDGSPRWKSHADHDIAAIPIRFSSDVQYQSFTFDQLATDVAGTERMDIAQPCMLACFPATLEASKLGYPVLRFGRIASYPVGPSAEQPTFLVDYSAFGGDSGGPLVSRIANPVMERANDSAPNSRLMVIGLVYAKQQQTDKTVSPIEERVTHTSLGLGIAVHSVFIREVLEMFEK